MWIVRLSSSDPSQGENNVTELFRCYVGDLATGEPMLQYLSEPMLQHFFRLISAFSLLFIQEHVRGSLTRIRTNLPARQCDGNIARRIHGWSESNLLRRSSQCPKLNGLFSIFFINEIPRNYRFPKGRGCAGPTYCAYTSIRLSSENHNRPHFQFAFHFRWLCSFDDWSDRMTQLQSESRLEFLFRCRVLLKTEI
jgi:hypothetical protein